MNLQGMSSKKNALLYNSISIMHRYFFIVALSIFISTNVISQESPKEFSINNFREYFSKHAYRGHQLTKGKTEQITAKKCIELLGDDGRFVDLIEDQNRIEDNKMNLVKDTEAQAFVSDVLELAFNRIWRIADTYRKQPFAKYHNDPIVWKLFKAINNYSSIEAERGSIGNGRFHISCFAIPTAAVNTYFCLFDAMENVENGGETRNDAVEANKSLLQMSYQSWTQPYRNDETDVNPVSVERFRNHVWWVGGNALGYRSVLPTAAAMRSVAMMDVLAEVAQGAMSFVSQNTYDEAFWTEGFTADGAGWGHGMQCLIWGYPIDGTSAVLELFEYFKGTPWANQVAKENAEALINYYRGSSWYYYKGYIPRCLDRNSMNWKDVGISKIKTSKMINTTVGSWLSAYSDFEQKELKDLQADIKDKQVSMPGYPDGLYNGTRWFFNNDNLIKKNTDYYMLISMASSRCDGIESFHEKADNFNFFTCDGMTYFMKKGNEYHQAIGGWNLTAIPGVTSRQGEERLIPITNWRGYCSKHNFAAAATSGGKNAASGFVFEKMNASDKKGVNDTTGSNDPNEWIYGVKATKGYFMIDDCLIALGAGITNLQPDMQGSIYTTIDQTLYNGKIQYESIKGVCETEGQVSQLLEAKDNIVWAEHTDGFAYAVLSDYTTGSVHLKAGQRPTKWKELNAANKKQNNMPSSVDVLQMHIDHGSNVQDGSYAYIVYAGQEKAKKAFEKMPLNILENTKDIQAVAWQDNYIGAAFYNPEKTLETSEGTIKVTAPCALLLEKDGNRCKLTVTDAEMNKDLNFITVKTTLPLQGKAVEDQAAWREIKVQMPQGAMCGKPATVELAWEK